MSRPGRQAEQAGAGLGPARSPRELSSLRPGAHSLQPAPALHLLESEAAEAIDAVLGPYAAARGARLTPEGRMLLARYTALLLDENTRVNLTAVSVARELVSRHLADAVEFVAQLSQKASSGPTRIADIGSGGGLPGIPVAILMPGARVTLIESIRKKAAFLERACAALGIGNTEILCERAEIVAHDPAHRERYGAVLLRACAALPVACEYALPLLQTGGLVLSPKGPSAEREALSAARALLVLGGRLESASAYRLPDAPAEFKMMVILKVRPCPPAYPRSAAAIGRKPL